MSYIWQDLKKYKWYVLFTFILFAAMTVLGDAIVPLYIKKITDALQESSFPSARGIVFILIIIYISQRILIYFSMQLLSYFESLLSRDLFRRTFENFTSHSYNFYSNEFTGSLVGKSKRLGINVINIIDTILFSFFGLAVSVISILVLLFIENTVIGLIFLAFLVTYFFLVQWMSKKMAPIYEERSFAMTALNSIISDILTNIQTVLLFSSHKKEMDNFQKSNENFHKKRYRAWRMAINYQDSIGFLPPLFTAGVTLYAIYLASIGVMTTGSVVLVFLLGDTFGNHIWRINRSIKDFVSNISDCVESIEIIEKKVEVLDPINPKKFSPQAGNIEMKNISFVYPEGEHVLNDFNLIIPSKQSIGIVGKSGSGKTTITKLLLRLYNIQAGSIYYDDFNINEITQKDLRQNIAYVPQETILFHRTIFENIAYGIENISKEEVYEAAKLAHVEEFVKEFDDGYETMVGERGIKLSGGQRQRIGIARAMLKKSAPVLIMDEATSSLDTLSEQFIQDSFEKLSKNRTTIVIAHRLSTIQKMDRIIVLDNGIIVEDGSHFELLKNNSHYAELWNSQSNGFTNE